MNNTTYRVYNIDSQEYVFRGDMLEILLQSELDTDFRNSIVDKRVIFEKFIGIQDKNGKDIYEGDIVEFSENKYNKLDAYLRSEPHVIRWGLEHDRQYPSASFVAIRLEPADLEDGYGLNSMDSPYMKIVGNCNKLKNQEDEVN